MIATTKIKNLMKVEWSRLCEIDGMFESDNLDDEFLENDDENISS
jgi:hypothetical protein